MLELEYLGSHLEVGVVVHDRHPVLSRKYRRQQIDDARRSMPAVPADKRSAWQRAVLPLDLVAAPVLTWALPVHGGGGVADAVRAMTAAGLLMQLSALAGRASPLTVATGTPVLVVE